MSATHKSSGPAAAAGARIENAIDTVLAEYAKGIEGAVDLSRKAVDLAAQQNAKLVQAWKSGADVAVEGFQHAVQAQKELLEIAVERGRVASRLVKENADSVSKTTAGVTAVFDTLAGFTTSAQKQAVDFAAVQNASAFDAAKRQFEASGQAAAEAFQRGVDTLVETQRVVLKTRDAA